MSTNLKVWCTIAVGLSVGLSSATVLAQRNEDDQTLEAMIGAGLTDSAIGFAEKQSQLWQSVPSEFARWRKRLMEAHAQHGLRQIGLESESQAWDACEQVYQQFSEQHAANPRLPWLQFQRARCLLLQAQGNLAVYLAAPANVAARERTLELVRTILLYGDELKEEVKQRQPIAAREGLKKRTQAPLKELYELKVDTALLECEALLVRAKLYEAGSADRTAAATEVDKRATDVLIIGGDEWTSVEALTVARATARLELGQFDVALAELSKMAREAQSPRIARQAAVAAAEYLIRTEELSRARQMLQLAEAAGPRQASVDLLRIQLELAQLNGLTESAKERKLAELLADSKQLGSRYGAYWRNRAEALVAGDSSSTSATSSSVDLLVVEVRQLLAAGEDEAATERLMEATRNEVAKGNAASASKLAEMSVALLQRAEQWTQAHQVAQETALAFQKQDAAAKLNLKGIAGLAQGLRGDPSPAMRERYEQALAMQLAYWPDSTETDTAQGWSRAWLVGQGKRAEFLELLLERAKKCSAVDVQVEVLTAWLADLLRSSDAITLSGVTDLRNAVDAGEFGNGSLPQSTLLVAKGFHAWPHGETAEEIDSFLRNRQLQVGWQDDVESRLLQALQMLRYAQLNKVQQANVLSEQWDLSALSVELQLGLAQGFVEAATEASQGAALWAKLLQLDAELARQLTRDKNISQQALGLRVESWLGDATALQRLRQLASSQPRNGWLQLQLSHALAESESGLADSTSIAKRLAANSKPGSELNFAARWRLMRNLVDSGRPEKAKQAAELFLASQPLEPGVWNDRFQALVK